MSGHRIIVSRYQRNGRDEVLVIDDPSLASPLQLHPGTNAVYGDHWAAAAKLEAVKAALAAGVLVDKGDAKEPAAPPAPADAEAAPAPVVEAQAAPAVEDEPAKGEA